MGIDIDGWVEVTNGDKGEYSWSGLIALSPLIDVCDEGSLLLFGIGKGDSELRPIAKDRGLPKYPSSSVQNSIKSLKDFEIEESNYSFDENFGFTNILFSELLESNVMDNLENTQWARVMRLIDVLVESGRYKANQVRLVVWAYI
jgi:hypothetical protein